MFVIEGYLSVYFRYGYPYMISVNRKNKKGTLPDSMYIPLHISTHPLIVNEYKFLKKDYSDKDDEIDAALL